MLLYAMASELYAVHSDGFYKGPVTGNPRDYWIRTATKIGSSSSIWTRLKFLFFGPDRDLYAVLSDGSFLKGPPPTHAQDNWKGHAAKIGTAGWGRLKFLFFGIDGDLYAVTADGTFVKGPLHCLVELKLVTTGAVMQQQSMLRMQNGQTSNFSFLVQITTFMPLREMGPS